MFVTATANKLDQKLIPGVGFCCAEPDNVAFGEDCGGFGLFGREKPLSVSDLGREDNGAWLTVFPREV